MPTKFYLHNRALQYGQTYPPANASAGTVAATFTPGQTNSVVATPLLTNLTMDDRITSSFQVSIAYTTDNVTTDQKQPFARWVSPPLAAQTIAAQSVLTQYCLSASSTASDFRTTPCLGIWRPSTGVRVAQWAAVGSISSNAATTSQALAQNTSMGAQLTTILAGDVIFYEIWRNANVQTMGTSYTNTIFFDGSTEGSLTSIAAYINFTNNVTLLTAPAPSDPYGTAIMAESSLRHYWRLGEVGGPMLDTKGSDSLGIETPTQTQILFQATTKSELGNVGVEGVAFGAQGRIRGMCADVLSGTAAWSVECWVNLASVPTGTGATIASSKGPNSGGWVIEARIAGANEGYQVTVGYSVNSSVIMVQNIIPSYGAWQHLVLTYSSAASGNILRFYVDGVQVSTNYVPAGNYRPNDSPWIGFMNSDYSAIETTSVKGEMDECAWYNTQLSAATVLAHYQAGNIMMPASALAGPVDAFV